MFTFTYPQFHAIFILPILGVLAVTTMPVGSEGMSARDSRRSVVRPPAVAVITLIALIYTVPWDNYLIQRGVWWYGDGQVTTVLWNAPISEYVFIVVVPLIGALWLHHLSFVLPAPRVPVKVTKRNRLTGFIAGTVIGVAGTVMIVGNGTFYLGSILAWSGPVLALQWAVGWPHLWARRRLVAAGVLAPTLYLSVIDRIAIASGTWQLSPELTTGITLGGLPVEEGLFFLITTAFIVQGLVLYPWVLARWQ